MPTQSKTFTERMHESVRKAQSFDVYAMFCEQMGEAYKRLPRDPRDDDDVGFVRRIVPISGSTLPYREVVDAWVAHVRPGMPPPAGVDAAREVIGGLVDLLHTYRRFLAPPTAGGWKGLYLVPQKFMRSA